MRSLNKLLKSVRKGDLTEIKRLILKKMPRHLVNQALNEALIMAAESGQFDAVRILVDMGAERLDDALLEAAKHGYTDIVEWLLKNNNFEGVTFPMLLAAKNGHLRSTMLLVEHGANELDSALYLAAEYGHAAIASYLIDHGATGFEQAKRIANEKGNIQVSLLFIENKLDLLIKEISKTTKNEVNNDHKEV